MDIPFTIAAEQGLLRQAVALSVIKQAAQADRQIAGILEQAIENVPVSASRGSRVNISA